MLYLSFKFVRKSFSKTVPRVGASLEMELHMFLFSAIMCYK